MLNCKSVRRLGECFCAECGVDLYFSVYGECYKRNKDFNNVHQKLSHQFNLTPEKNNFRRTARYTMRFIHKYEAI